MPYKNPPPCQICNSPSVARRLCEKHYTRWKRYGDAEKTLRPDDWGKRGKHPLSERWAQIKRTRQGRVSRWDDFWNFVDDVGDRPSDQHRIVRLDRSLPFGPANFIWQKHIQEQHARKDKALYQRNWRKKNRLKSKSLDLKKRYGITLSQYDGMLEAQNGVCAICKNPETHREFMCVDHCHTTKRVRGLLCGLCNRALGGFRDNPKYLAAAIKYLEASP